METLLIDEWRALYSAESDSAESAEGLAGSSSSQSSSSSSSITTVIRDDASFTIIRDSIRAIGAATSTSKDIVDRACLVASEMGRNQLRHAMKGHIIVRSVTQESSGACGLEIVGFDHGVGIEKVAEALDASLRARSHGSLGVGIGSIRRLSSEVDFDVRLRQGTRILARIFDSHDTVDSAVRREKREIGMFGRPIDGESTSGDHADFFRPRAANSDSHSNSHSNSSLAPLRVMLVDGLGHGPLAREAAEGAIRIFDRETRAKQRAADHDGGFALSLIAACHSELATTRGVVLAHATFGGNDGRDLEVASVGNVDVQIVRPRYAKRIGGTSAIVGGRGNHAPKAHIETLRLEPDDVVVMSTDGIVSRMSIETELALLREHPIVIAQRIVEQFARPADDALVVVLR